MRTPEAIIVHDGLPAEMVDVIEGCLREAGWEKVLILSRFPEVVESGQFLILDEEVGMFSAESLLAGVTESNVGTCVLVSRPYVEKVTRLKFGRVQLSDMVVIKGPPEEPGHLDMSIASTVQPAHITALFKRIRKSLADEQ